MFELLTQSSRHLEKFGGHEMAAGLTLLFILIVNRIVHHSLKKIDMVESLKSVE